MKTENPLSAGGGAGHAGAAVPGRGGAEGSVGGDPGRPVPGGPPPPGRDLVTNLRKVRSFTSTEKAPTPG